MPLSPTYEFNPEEISHESSSPQMGCNCSYCEEFLSNHPNYQGPWLAPSTLPQYVEQPEQPLQPGYFTAAPPIQNPMFQPGAIQPGVALNQFHVSFDEYTQAMQINPNMVAQFQATGGGGVSMTTAHTSKKKKLEEPFTDMRVDGGIPIKSAMDIHSEILSSKVFYILRGIPGSAKSTLATILNLGLRKIGPILTMPIQLEDCFQALNKQDQLVYYYDESKLAEAHLSCQTQVRDEMVKQNRAVILALCLISKQQMQPYLRLAREFDYQVMEIICKGTFQNIHGVPPDKLRSMKQNFEY